MMTAEEKTARRAAAYNRYKKMKADGEELWGWVAQLGERYNYGTRTRTQVPDIIIRTIIPNGIRNNHRTGKNSLFVRSDSTH